MTSYTSNGQQTVFDVALMHYGSLDGLARLLTDNQGLIKDDGSVQQFRVAHLIAPKFSTNEFIKVRMLQLVPCSEGPGLLNGSLIDDDDRDELLDDSGHSIFDR